MAKMSSFEKKMLAAAREQVKSEKGFAIRSPRE